MSKKKSLAKKSGGGRKKGLKKKKVAKKAPSSGKPMVLADAPMVDVASIRSSSEFMIRKVVRESQQYQNLLESVNRNGILQPLLLKGNVLVAGYHRLDIAKLLKMKSVPAFQVEGAPAEILMASYDLNDLSVPMTPMGRAKTIKRAMEAVGTTKNAVLAKKMGRTDHFIGTHVKLLELPKEIQEALDSGDSTITIGKCRQLLRLSPEDRLKQWPRMREMTEPYFKAYIESLVETGDASWESGASKPKKKKDEKKSAHERATRKKAAKKKAASTKPTATAKPQEPVLEVMSVAQVQRDIRKVEAAMKTLEERRKKALKKAEDAAKKKKLKGQKRTDFLAGKMAKWEAANNYVAQNGYLRGYFAMGLNVLSLDRQQPSLDAALKTWKDSFKKASKKKAAPKKKKAAKKKKPRKK